jgi:hypothetical protein
MIVSIDCRIQNDVVECISCSVWSFAQKLMKQWYCKEEAQLEGRVTDNKMIGQYVKLLVIHNVGRKRKQSSRRICRTVTGNGYHQSNSRTLQSQ